ACRAEIHLGFSSLFQEILPHRQPLMSHGPSAASTSPRLGGRQASVPHPASLRQPATRALPAAEQTKCGTSLCLDGPIPRLDPCWTPLLETRAHRATGRGFHPLRRAASAILRPAS